MTAGALSGVSLMIQMLVGSETQDSPHSSGILIPTPQRPLYTSTLSQFPGVLLPYRLDERRDHVSTLTEVNATLAHAREKGVAPRGLIVDNLGDPVGTPLDESTQEGLVGLCEEHNLVLMFNEVHQFDAHHPEKVHLSSFKKIVRKMNSPVALVSCNSLFEDALTEGRRGGGYFELTNFSDELVAVVCKVVRADTRCNIVQKLTFLPLRFQPNSVHQYLVKLMSTVWSAHQDPVLPHTISG